MATEALSKTMPKDESASRANTPSLHREPLFSFGTLRDDFDRMFDRYTRNWPIPWAGKGGRWLTEIEEGDNSVVIRAEAPGFEASDFDIRMSDGRLIMHAVRKAEAKEKDGKSREFREQEFHESVSLPMGIDREKIEARYRNGVLTVTMAKTADGKAKRITVKAD